MIPLLFAASLNISSPFVVVPNRRSVVTIKGSASLSNSKPGFYKITTHFPRSEQQQKSVGDEIQSVRLSPPRFRLKDNKSRKFVANIALDSNYSGLIYTCIISDDPPAKNQGLLLVARSCYANRVSPK